ncbi:hypothetical protein KAR91_17465 [Candidatus Pacearchaeota archaeon]|nr:hypothetical protein [Candidatus Pacearchaeota archaeon]
MKNICNVEDLKPDSYIATIRNGELNCAFLFDDEKRFTRLWDGSFVDSFFKGRSFNIKKVVVITKQTALDLVKKERSYWR